MDNKEVLWAFVILSSWLAFLCICTCRRYCRQHREEDLEVITPLRPTQLAGDILTTNQDLSNECAICLECFDAGEKLRVLDCGHYYHQDCVDPWLGDGHKCPKCRGENIV